MFNSTSKTQALKEKSSNIMSVFTKTLADLTAINDEMSIENAKLGAEQDEIKRKADAEIARKQEDRDALAQEIADNSKIAAKIESFWETPVFDNHLDNNLSGKPNEGDDGHDPEEIK